MIEFEPGHGYRLVTPEQQAFAWAVEYSRAHTDGWLLEVHSHRGAPARFSSTDTRDEQGLRLYGVLGGLDQTVPQVNIRCGAYGYFMPVPWSAVFDGTPEAVQAVNAAVWGGQ